MKKRLFLCALLFSANASNAANLIDVYNQALTSDTIYQQAIAQTLANEEGVPISRAALFPAGALTLTPSVQRTLESGPGASVAQSNGSPTRFTQRGYQMQLSVTQTLFDFGKVANLMGARAIAKQADASLNAAVQSLIVRVAQAYFQVLLDEDTLASVNSTKAAYAKQLDQVTQQYKVGLKTITDVYTAQASYESSVASAIAAKNQIAIDKENLRVITGVFYPRLSKLSEKFPLLSPKPANMETWVTLSREQNWSIKAAQFFAESARQNIKQQFAGNLPTLNVQGNYIAGHSRYLSANVPLPGSDSEGALTSHESQLLLNLNLPLFSGGSVIAQTTQAQYQYQLAQQQLEQSLRNTINQARQSYLDITASISKIEADKRAILSARSSYEGLEEGYRVGTETLVNVLTQQQAVYQAEVQYATDRYAYVNNLLSLKQAAGTLSPDDLAMINTWLTEGSPRSVSDSYTPPDPSQSTAQNTQTTTPVRHEKTKKLVKKAEKVTAKATPTNPEQNRKLAAKVAAELKPRYTRTVAKVAAAMKKNDLLTS